MGPATDLVVRRLSGGEASQPLEAAGTSSQGSASYRASRRDSTCSRSTTSSGAVATVLIVSFELPAVEAQTLLEFRITNDPEHGVWDGLASMLRDFAERYEGDLQLMDAQGSRGKLDRLRVRASRALNQWRGTVRVAEEQVAEVEKERCQMKGMREAYFKELTHLREQLNQRSMHAKVGKEFEPAELTIFDREDYDFGGELGRTMREKAEELQKKYDEKVKDVLTRYQEQVSNMTIRLNTAKYHLEKKHQLLQALIMRHRVDQSELQELQQMIDKQMQMSEEAAGLETPEEFRFPDPGKEWPGDDARDACIPEAAGSSDDTCQTPSACPMSGPLAGKARRSRPSRLRSMVSRVADMARAPSKSRTNGRRSSPDADTVGEVNMCTTPRSVDWNSTTCSTPNSRKTWMKSTSCSVHRFSSLVPFTPSASSSSRSLGCRSNQVADAAGRYDDPGLHVHGAAVPGNSPASSDARRYRDTPRKTTPRKDTRDAEVQAAPATAERKVQASAQVREASAQCAAPTADQDSQTCQLLQPWQSQASPGVASILQRHGVMMDSSAAEPTSPGMQMTWSPGHPAAASGADPKNGRRRGKPGLTRPGSPKPRNLEPLHSAPAPLCPTKSSPSSSPPPRCGTPSLPEVVTAAPSLAVEAGSRGANKKIGIAGRGDLNPGGSGSGSANSSWASPSGGSVNAMGMAAVGLGPTPRKVRPSLEPPAVEGRCKRSSVS